MLTEATEATGAPSEFSNFLLMKLLRPACLLVFEDLCGGKVFEVLMI